MLHLLTLGGRWPACDMPALLTRQILAALCDTGLRFIYKGLVEQSRRSAISQTLTTERLISLHFIFE